MIGTISNKYNMALNTLKSIKQYGFDAIELNGFMIHPTSFLVRILTKMAGMPTGKGGKLDWKQLVKEADLKVSGLHFDLGTLKRDINSCIKEAKEFNTNYIIVTGMYRFNYQDKNELNKLCDDLNNVGKILKENDINLLYHNHNVEFKRLDNNMFVYDYLIDNLNSECVNFEFDSYWAIDGGINALEYIEKLGNRIKLFHINDKGNRKKGPFVTPILTSDAIELGKGSINLDALINKAKENGVETIILEQHRNFINNSPLESIKISGEFLNNYK